MLEVYGNKDEIWELDDKLRDVAQVLLQENPDLADYIELDKIVFVRVDGVTLSKSGKNWLGKCWYLREPLSMVVNYAFQHLRDEGLLDFSRLGTSESLLDLRYIIGLNTDAIAEIGSDVVQQEKIVLHHELLHIRVDGKGLVPHPVQDFATILDKYGIFWTNGVFKQGSLPQAPPDFLANFAQNLKIRGSDIKDESE